MAMQVAITLRTGATYDATVGALVAEEAANRLRDAVNYAVEVDSKTVTNLSPGMDVAVVLDTLAPYDATVAGLIAPGLANWLGLRLARTVSVTVKTVTDTDPPEEEEEVSALTYPTFRVFHYGGGVTPLEVAAEETYAQVPLDTSLGATVTNPEGWEIESGFLYLPDGLYTVFWYWEQQGAPGVFFDNYIDMGGIGGAGVSGQLYPVAPMANPDSFWGSGTTTAKFTQGASVNYVAFTTTNRDSSPHDLLNIINIIRLDA